MDERIGFLYEAIRTLDQALAQVMKRQTLLEEDNAKLKTILDRINTRQKKHGALPLDDQSPSGLILLH